MRSLRNEKPPVWGAFGLKCLWYRPILRSEGAREGCPIISFSDIGRRYLLFKPKYFFEKREKYEKNKVSQNFLIFYTLPYFWTLNRFRHVLDRKNGSITD